MLDDDVVFEYGILYIYYAVCPECTSSFYFRLWTWSSGRWPDCRTRTVEVWACLLWFLLSDLWRLMCPIWSEPSLHTRSLPWRVTPWFVLQTSRRWPGFYRSWEPPSLLFGPGHRLWNMVLSRFLNLYPVSDFLFCMSARVPESHENTWWSRLPISRASLWGNDCMIPDFRQWTLGKW